MSKFYVIIAPKINYIFENFIGRGTWGAHRILRLWLHGQLVQHASSLFVAQRPPTYSPGNRKKLGVAPSEFRHEPDICKQTRFWFSVSEEIFVPFNTISERDGQTDIQTDGHLCYSNTSTCIACYDTATALVKKSCFHTWKSFRPPYFTFPNLLEILITPLILLDAAFSTPAFSAPQRDHWRTRSAAVPTMRRLRGSEEDYRVATLLQRRQFTLIGQLSLTLLEFNRVDQKRGHSAFCRISRKLYHRYLGLHDFCRHQG